MLFSGSRTHIYKLGNNVLSVLTNRGVQYLLAHKNLFLFIDVTGIFLKNNIFANLWVRGLVTFTSTYFILPNNNISIFTNWMFREFNEFYFNLFKLRDDNRNLLLDYNLLDKPLQKNFPTSGYKEVYFNFSKSRVSYININVVEL